jgi:hypothetical protein
VEYLRKKYGMQDVVLMLRAISEGRSTEAALKARTRSDYGQLEQELGQYLSGSLAASGSQ